MSLIYYHGTNEKGAKEILQSGFKERSYFTIDLHNSLLTGGPWIFGIYFENQPLPQKWEFIHEEHIPPEKILFLRKFTVEKIYDNENESEKIIKISNQKQYGENVLHCGICKGTGILSNDNKTYNQLNNKNIIPCDECGGYGCFKPNGKRINEPDDEVITKNENSNNEK